MVNNTTSTLSIKPSKHERRDGLYRPSALLFQRSMSCLCVAALWGFPPAASRKRPSAPPFYLTMVRKIHTFIAASSIAIVPFCLLAILEKRHHNRAGAKVCSDYAAHRCVANLPQMPLQMWRLSSMYFNKAHRKVRCTPSSTGLLNQCRPPRQSPERADCSPS